MNKLMQLNTLVRFTLLAALLTLPLGGHANGASTVDLQPYTAVYELRKKGMTIAEATFTLERGGGDKNWIFRSHAKPRGLAAILTSQTVSEQSRFSLSPEGRIQPSSYAIEHSDAERAAEDDLRVRYDWQAGRATVHYRGETSQIDLDSPLFDPLTEQAALMLALRDPPERIAYRVVDDGRAEQHRYAVAGEETVETGDGAQPSTKLVRNHGKRRTVMWLARDLNHLPVKIRRYRNDALKSELVLTGVTFE